MSEKRERVNAEERADKLRYTCYPLTLIAAKDKAFDEIIKAIKEAEAQARADVEAIWKAKFVFQRATDLTDGFDDGWIACRKEVAKIALRPHRGSVPQEHAFYYRGRKDEAMRIAKEARSLQPPSEAGR